MIKWPWVSRRKYEFAVSEFNRCEDDALKYYQAMVTLQSEVAELRYQLAQEKSLKAAAAANKITSDSETLIALLPNTRGGWRGLATAMSERTIPAEADSMAQLGKRVADAGGKA